MVSLQAAVLALAVTGVGDTVLLDFYADWCGPCRQMAGTVDRLSERGYPIRKVNVDHEKELAAQFNVRGIPCFVLVSDGRVVARREGACAQSELERMFQTVRGAGQMERAVARGQSPDEQPGRMPFPSTQSEGTLSGAAAPAAGQAVVDPFAQKTAPAAGNSRAAAGPPQVDAEAKAKADAVARRLLAASVRLRIDDGGGHSVGSGTIIDARAGEALILTCAHVFRDSEGEGPIAIDLFGPDAPQGIPGKLVSYDLNSDVGLVSCRPGVPVVAARIAPETYGVRMDQSVINIGCNHGETPTARLSRISAIDKFLGPPNLVVAGQPVQGRSGGGLFTTDGLLIGVCNAADPSEDEGLYAALAPIHGELERMGLDAMCLEVVDPETGNASVALAEPPAMPDEMPSPARDRSAAGWLPTSDAGQNALVQPLAGSEALTTEETAALAELRRRGSGAEVICIVRPLSDPRAKSEIIVLDRASPAFLEQLTSEQQVQDARHLTSLRQRPTEGRKLPPARTRKP
ncbi:MAG TPA: thioredoxin domain-containing protein [Pirellulales bacterium]|nr:thioredoxin domain-containing protein [Pirellulales bacterium]